jgi:hypothetical protein
MKKDLNLIKNAGVEGYPFKAGDRVFIRWFRAEPSYGTITELLTSWQ